MKLMKQMIDQGVLQAALIGFELQRNRIEAAIAEIQTELGQGDSSRSTATAAASAEPKTTGKKRFTAAARKRMAAAQRKRWQLLKAKKAEAAKPKRKSTAKRKKARIATARKQRPVQVKATKNVASKTRKATPNVGTVVAKSEVQEPAPQAQVTAEATSIPATTEAV
jgi:hypothetical protein